MPAKDHDIPLAILAAHLAAAPKRMHGFVRTKTLKAFPETAYREIIRSLG
jgi:uncharacterized protein with GYD domain